MVSIRFARLNFKPNLSDYTEPENIRERRREALLSIVDWDTDVNQLISESDASRQIKNDDWGFGGIHSDENLIYGRLAKEREASGRVSDPELRDYVPEEREDNDISFFVIDLDSNIMAYEFRRNVGPKAPFRVIEAAFNGRFEEHSLSAIPIIDSSEFEIEVQQFRRVTELIFSNLHRPNPHSTDSSETMDDFLRDSGIYQLDFDAKSDESGSIDVEGTPLLDGGISLAQEGYGSAKVAGEDERGIRREVSTEDNPIEVEAEMSEDDDQANRRRLIEEIHYLLDRLED